MTLGPGQILDAVCARAGAWLLSTYVHSPYMPAIGWPSQHMIPPHW
jgi:hypothetical protein